MANLYHPLKAERLRNQENGEKTSPYTGDSFFELERIGREQSEMFSPPNLPTSPRIEKALELAKQGLYTDAEIEFSKAIVSEQNPSDYIHFALFLARGGRLTTARDWLERAIRLVENQGDLESVAIACLYQGFVLQTLGDLEDAKKMYLRALEIYERIGNLEGMADVYLNLGNMYQIHGELDAAETMYRKALKINKDLHRSEGMASSYNNLGIIRRIRNELDSAESLHRKALEIYEHVSRLDGVADAYANLGNVFFISRELSAAEEMHNKALEIYKQLGRLEGMADAYGNLGKIKFRIGKLERAEEMFRNALEINEWLNRREEMANVYNNLGCLLTKRDLLEDAETMLRRALEINERLGNTEGIASVYLNLGDVWQKRGKLHGAKQFYQKTLEIARKFGYGEMANKVAQQELEYPQGEMNLTGDDSIDLMNENDIDMATLLDESISALESGQVIIGTVLKVTSDDVVVDIGSKSEGLIPLQEFLDEDKDLKVYVGMDVDVMVVKREGPDGLPVLSRRRAKQAAEMRLEAVNENESTSASRQSLSSG